MKCSPGISNFLEEISSLSHLIVFLYFLALITEEGFLISPCYSWNSEFKSVYLSFSPLFFASLLFTAMCKAFSDNHFAFFNFFFLVMVLIPASCSVQFSSVAQSCPTVYDPMNHSMPGLPVHHQLPEFTQTHVHQVGDAIQPSHPLSSPSPPAPNSSQHEGVCQ